MNVMRSVLGGVFIFSLRYCCQFCLFHHISHIIYAISTIFERVQNVSLFIWWINLRVISFSWLIFPIDVYVVQFLLQRARESMHRHLFKPLKVYFQQNIMDLFTSTSLPLDTCSLSHSFFHSRSLFHTFMHIFSRFLNPKRTREAILKEIAH